MDYHLASLTKRGGDGSDGEENKDKNRSRPSPNV